MDLRSITRLRRLGAGSEQSMARTLTGAMTRPIDASRQGATRPAPRCSAKRPILKSRRTRKRLLVLGVPALGGAHRCGCHDDKTADLGESRCLWLPQVPWSGLGFPAATLCTDPAIGRFFPLPCGRSGRKRIPRGLWPIVEGWRLIATTDGPTLRLFDRCVKLTRALCAVSRVRCQSAVNDDVFGARRLDSVTV